jgi:hypothetical protein
LLSAENCRGVTVKSEKMDEVIGEPIAFWKEYSKVLEKATNKLP